jgi:predicted phosphoribosyltransferase
MSAMRFANRLDAGRRLADDLASRAFDRPVVIGLPRGGVPVGAEVAARLQAPLDVLVVRKLAYPVRPELGMGAVAEGEARVLNEDLIAELGVPVEQLEGVIAIENAEVKRRVHRYRGDRPAVILRGHTAILVDDGLATGFTARAGVEVLRRQGARSIVLAVPVAPIDAIRDLRTHADEVICLSIPHRFMDIGRSYADFGPVTDDEVVELLARPPVPTGTAH